MNDVCIDLTPFQFESIQEINRVIEQSPAYKQRRYNNLKFIVVTQQQRFKIYQDGNQHDIDTNDDSYKGYKMAVAR